MIPTGKISLFAIESGTGKTCIATEMLYYLAIEYNNLLIPALMVVKPKPGMIVVGNLTDTRKHV